MSVPALGHWAFAHGILTSLGERIHPLVRQPWFPTLVNVAALALLASGLARWTWQVFTPMGPQVPAATASVARAGVTFDLRTLQGAQLFGAAPYASGTNLDQIPVSSLNMVLTGLVATGKESFALIKVEGQPEVPFSVGQEVVSGAVLQAVYPDRAIILRGGMPESLLLESAPSSSPNPSIGPQTPARGRMTPPVRTPTPLSAVIQEQAPYQYAVKRSFLDEQIRAPQQALSQAVVVPHSSGGFLVREIKPGSVYEHLGLRVGDIIRRLNGQELTSMEDVMKAYQQFGGQDQVRLQVIRAGQPKSLQYTLQ